MRGVLAHELVDEATSAELKVRVGKIAAAHALVA
jgi:hypothetical protein